MQLDSKTMYDAFIYVCFTPAVVHQNFRAGLTFPVSVCTVPSSMDRTSRCNKVDAVRLDASYRLNLLLLKGQICVVRTAYITHLTNLAFSNVDWNSENSAALACCKYFQLFFFQQLLVSRQTMIARIKLVKIEQFHVF